MKFLKKHLQDCAEEFMEDVTDKIAWICSQLESKGRAGPLEMPGEFDPVGPKEVDKVY